MDYLAKYQEGVAPMPPQEGGQGGDPMQALVEGAMQAVQTNDPAMAMQVCQMIVQMAQGGAQPPAEAQQAPPAFKRGGKIVMRKPKVAKT